MGLPRNRVPGRTWILNGEMKMGVGKGSSGGGWAGRRELRIRGVSIAEMLSGRLYCKTRWTI